LGIRQHVEAGNEGKIVVIDIETGVFEVGDTVMAATDHLFESIPDAQPWTIRLGHRAVYHCYVVSLPEWCDDCHTHGDTYEETLHNAREVLELLTESTLGEGKPLPAPQRFGQVLQPT